MGWKIALAAMLVLFLPVWVAIIVGLVEHVCAMWEDFFDWVRQVFRG